MARRFYLCPVIGSGNDDIGDGYRPKAADMGFALSWQIENDPVTGKPLQSKSVVCVDADDFSAIEADPDFVDVTADGAT